MFSSNFLTTEAAGEKSNHFSLRLSGPFYFFNSLISVVKSKIQQLDENYKDLYHSSCAQITAFSWSHFKIFSSLTGTWLGRGWSHQGTKHSLMKNAPRAGEKLLQDSNTQSSNTALRNRPGYILHKIFSGLSIFEGTEPLLVIWRLRNRSEVRNVGVGVARVVVSSYLSISTIVVQIQYNYTAFYIIFWWIPSGWRRKGRS